MDNMWIAARHGGSDVLIMFSFGDESTGNRFKDLLMYVQHDQTPA